MVDNVYGVNRQPQNSIAIYSADEDGRLTLLDHVSTGGDHARTFTITRDGRFLYIGNSNFQTVTVFARDADTGLLTKLEAYEQKEFSDRVIFVGTHVGRQLPIDATGDNHRKICTILLPHDNQTPKHSGGPR